MADRHRLEVGIAGKVVTWRAQGHQALIHFLFPDHDDAGRALTCSKHYYVDHQIHLKDLSGFCWTPGPHSDLFHYIQAYTTEKAISYQLHQGIFSFWNPSELLSERLCRKLLNDLETQSEIISDCTGDAPEQRNSPQEGCARLEV